MIRLAGSDRTGSDPVVREKFGIYREVRTGRQASSLYWPYLWSKSRHSWSSHVAWFLSPIGWGKARVFVARHKKNTVHSGVIESCKNRESLCNLYFVQLLLSSATKYRFKISKLVIRYGQSPARNRTGPDQNLARFRTRYPVGSHTWSWQGKVFCSFKLLFSMQMTMLIHYLGNNCLWYYQNTS